jgi:competence protein ComEA
VPPKRQTRGFGPLFEQLERFRWLIVALLAVPLLSGIGFVLNERIQERDPLVISATDLPEADIRVYVAGAVERPGVYPMPEGARWIDALEAAGGPTEDANLNAINLARRVQDEDQIIVPRLNQPAAAGAAQTPLIDINTASESDLESLPGIGEVRAQRIVQSRLTDGPFATIDDLLTRKLIPKSVFDQIQPLITVSQ